MEKKRLFQNKNKNRNNGNIEEYNIIMAWLKIKEFLIPQINVLFKLNN